MSCNGKLRVCSQEGVLYFRVSKPDNVPAAMEQKIRIVYDIGYVNDCALAHGNLQLESFINRS